MGINQLLFFTFMRLFMASALRPFSACVLVSRWIGVADKFLTGGYPAMEPGVAKAPGVETPLIIFI